MTSTWTPRALKRGSDPRAKNLYTRIPQWLANVCAITSQWLFWGYLPAIRGSWAVCVLDGFKGAIPLFLGTTHRYVPRVKILLLVWIGMVNYQPCRKFRLPEVDHGGCAFFSLGIDHRGSFWFTLILFIRESSERPFY